MGRLTMGIAMVIAALAISTSAASASDVPCSKLSAGKYQCSFYPAGDGISAGAPVQDSTGARVGYLNHGANWIVCQASGATVHNGAYFNRWWGYTEANDHRWGWVNAIWGRGGDNDQGFAGVPNCHGTKGYPPGATPPKPKPKPKHLPKNMVVLGDSYSAGEGTDPNSGFSCFRSPKAYGWLVASTLGYRMTGFEACGGATTISVLNDQLSAVNASTTLVTMSVGGNDADFAGVLGRCAAGFGLVTGPCKNFIKKESGIIRDQIPGRLDRLYSSIRAAAPHARVVIVDYPYLFSRTCVKSGPLQWLIAPTDLLDDVIKAAAARHGFSFVDVRGPFTGHSVCDKDAWINHLYTHDPYKSFHPNEAGYREDAKLVEAAL